ncbi:unnamed protein product [Plasmodium vivax]|uniref:(malaria parasite P. vivax) hypothetical protein n=1 Tax=Plasmodium vivax TaxID=5855 RepID=A0A8S4HJA2_PLAVI|nr:unnamed protein product [Plasmodium vivax]
MEESIYFYVSRFPDLNKKIISPVENLKSDPSYKICETFKKNHLKSYKGVDDSFLNSCAKFSKSINEIKTKPELSEPAFCRYINYWFYESLNSEVPSKYSALLPKFFDEITSLKPCKTYQRTISAHKYGELKKLYDLYNDFDKFKEQSKEDGDGTCTNGQKCTDIYEENVVACKSNYNNGFCWNLIKLREEYLDYTTNTTKCKDKIKYLEPIKSDLAATISLSFVLMTLISFILLYSYKFTSFGPWISTKLGGKNRTNKLDKRIQRLQNTSENDGTRYKLPCHSS